jgi:magnesium transporter
VRESMVSIGRLVLFLANDAEGLKLQKEQRSLLKSMTRDVASLADHATFLANKVTFLLDATLGMVTLEQNNVIKIFSVAAVVLLPPTMVASIYGMNFRHMPELDWIYGYPYALALMLAAAVVPYTFFKWMKWL